MPNTIEHVGVVVDDVAEAKAFLGDVPGFEYHREVDLPQRGVKVAFFRSGSIEVEVIECVDDALREGRLGPHGTRTRIEHIDVGRRPHREIPRGGQSESWRCPCRAATRLALNIGEATNLAPFAGLVTAAADGRPRG